MQALRPTIRAKESADRGRSLLEGRATFVRYRVLGPELPPMGQALGVGEALKAAVLGALGEVFPGATPEPFRPNFGGRKPSDHAHPFYFAEDEDGDGGIDHLVLHVPKGFAGRHLEALRRVQPLAGEGPLPMGRLELAWFGRADADAPGVLVAPFGVWRSATPYVPDLHLDRRFDIEMAFRRDLARRGLEPAKVERIAGPRGFAVRRTQGERREARGRHAGAWFRLTFDRMQDGPIALGFACHFGLGLFRHDPAPSPRNLA